MKPKFLFRRFLAWPAIVLAAGALTPAVHAADLSYNTAATLTLTGVISYDNVRIGSGGGSAATIVDATGSTSWTSSGTVFYVGAHTSNTSVGTLNLGILNTITATQMTIGGLEPDSNSQTGHSGTVTTLANGVTTINAGNMAVGTGKSNSANGGKFTLGSGATLNLYGLAGSGSRSSLVVGRWSAFNSHSGKGNVDLGAGIANLHLTELAVGKATAGTGGSGTQVSGQMTLSTNASNHLDVSGAGSVVKVGYNTDTSVTSTGTLTIGNLDSTSSITSTDNSTAILIGSKGNGSANGTLNFNGGTLKITTTGAAIAGGGGTSTLNLSGGAKLIAGSNSTNWIHSLGTAAIGTGGATIDTDGKTVAFAQAFSGAGGLTKAGAGTLTLNGANSYGGTTTVSNGTLALGSADRISNSSALSVAGGTFNLGGFTETVAAVSMSSGTISNGTLTGSSYSFTNSGAVTASLAGSGATLTKSGAGTVTLGTELVPVTHSYTGATNVTGGTLVVNGNISTSSLTTIGNGVDAATLQGTGTVGDLTIAANAFHNPGNSPGIVNTGDYTMLGTLTTEINGIAPGTQHDQVNVTGTITLGGTLVTSFAPGIYANGDLIFILLNDSNDVISSTFSGLAQGAYVTTYGGFDWTISYVANSGVTPGFTGGNDVALMATAVIPEPAAAILGSLGMVLLLRRRRVA